MKKRTVWFIVTLGLVAGAYRFYKYLYKDHRDIAAEEIAFRYEAIQLQEEFVNGNSKALNQTISVTGTITEVKENVVSLDHVVVGVVDTSQELKTGVQISLKGRCLGYDDLFETVNLDQCVLIDQP